MCLEIIYLIYVLKRFVAQSAGAVEYTDCFSAGVGLISPFNECPRYDTKQSDAGALGNAVYFFIAIAPRSTLAWSGNIW